MSDKEYLLDDLRNQMEQEMYNLHSIHDKDKEAKQRASPAFEAVKVSETFLPVKYINTWHMVASWIWQEPVRETRKAELEGNAS